MQRPQGISAHAGDAPGEPDVGLRLSAALKRLAALRATIHGDWSDGPASLLEVANPDVPAGDTLGWAMDVALRARGPELASTPIAEHPIVAPTIALRGRFAETDDTVALVGPVDVSWLDLMVEDAAPAERPAFKPVCDEIVVALAFAEDFEVLAQTARHSAMAAKAHTAPPAEVHGEGHTDARAEDLSGNLTEASTTTCTQTSTKASTPASTPASTQAFVNPAVDPARARAEAQGSFSHDIVEIDDVEPAFAIGAAPGVLVHLLGDDGASAALAALAVADAVVDAVDAVLGDAGIYFAVGAHAGLGGLLAGALDAFEPSPQGPVGIAGRSALDDDSDDRDPAIMLAFGAAPDLIANAVSVAPAATLFSTHPSASAATPLRDDTTAPGDDQDVLCAPFGLAAALALPVPQAQDASAPACFALADDDAEPDLAVGAFALWFDAPAQTVAVEDVAVAVSVFDAPAPEIAFGAAPMLARWFDMLPALDTTAPVVRQFDPMSLIDDALADAFDALVCAHDPIDPFEPAWTPESFPESDHAASLAALEAHFWALPRHVPCVETFLATPNHETAVRITRALRVRANVLEARAFAETAAFGFLKSDTDAQAFWFLADALHDAASLSAGDADVDASFADWRMNDDGLLVVTAPDNAHPRRPAPLISEAELDALFAHVDEAQSRVVLDDLGDDPTWNETFWCDVDTYLEHVSETMDPAFTEHASGNGEDIDIHDIEVRARPVAPPAPTTTFFWMPGDDLDLAVEGDGDDLFIVGANETPAVILVEDGSTYAMRTGKSARMDEVVISLSFDTWRDIDGMQWSRLATLSGIGHIRVEQNSAATRQAVLAGSFFATTLEDEKVRLVRSGDNGDVDCPVTRVGGSSIDIDAGWPFTDVHVDTDPYVVV